VRGSRVAVAGLAALLGCQPSTEDCGGFCGEGTVCEAGKCVVAPPPSTEPEPEPAPEDGKSRRRRRGKRRGGGDDDAPAAGGLPDKDGHIPRYRADRDEQIGEGGERLSDRKVRQELSGLEPKFNDCLQRASAVTDAALTGTVSFQIGIEPSGKVWGINAKLPSSWDVPGLRACFRKVIWGHRFPSWSGPSMGVDYHFKVD
jgi:hypothetical protein